MPEEDWDYVFKYMFNNEKNCMWRLFGPQNGPRNLGSGLIDQSQKQTVAAMAIADMKVCAQRS